MPFDDIGRVEIPSRLAAWAEIDWQKFVPDIHHIEPNIVLLVDGSLLAVVEMPSYPFQLEEMQIRDTRRLQFDQLWKNVADSNVTFGSHLWHRRCEPSPLNTGFRTDFSRELFSTYRRNCLASTLCANAWYFTVIVSPRFAPGRALRRMLTSKTQKPSASAGVVRQMKAILQAIMAPLSREGGKLLGYRFANGDRFSAIAEARRACLYGQWRPVPVLDGPLGAAIYNERIVCGARAIRINGFSGPRYAKVIAFNRYPTKSRTGQLAQILDLKSDFVLAQTFKCASRSSSETSIYFAQTHLSNALGVQQKAIDALDDAAENVQGGEVIRGDHNLGLIVYAPDLEALDIASGPAASAIDAAGGSPIHDDGNYFNALWSTLPGNPEGMKARKGNIRTDNFTALSEFNGYPTGQTKGPWGTSLVEFKTSADTVFGWQPFVGEGANTLFLGRIRSGKTLTMNLLISALEQWA